MSFFHDDLTGFGAFPTHGHNPHDALGQQVTLSEDGVLSPLSAGHGGGHGGGGGGAGGGTGGTTGGTTPTQQPGSTLVTAAGSNLAIDLIWDSSVSSAPTGFTSAVVAAVTALVTDLSAPRATELYINVGWGEVGGQALASGNLGQSQSYGYLSSYATVANALKANGDVVSASNEPTSGQFFLTSAEAKVLGISSGSSTDGYIGFAALSNWQFNATGTAAGQYNLQALVQHEVTEVMGRASMEGTVIYNGVKTYTPLDLFDFSAPGTLALSNTGGYFSNDNGATQMGVFNNASMYGGDIADWSSYASNSASQTLASTQQDPFDAFSRTGYDLALSGDDLLVMAALGYKLTPTGSALA